MIDLVIRNGHVLDPYGGIDAVTDVAVEDGMISFVGSSEGNHCRQAVDASGCIVTPGLIDLHTHLWPLAPIGVQPESYCFPSGVTMAADGGSAGCALYEALRPALASCRVRTRAFLNVCSTGLASLGSSPEDIDPSHYDIANIRRLLKAYPNELTGLKIRMGKEIVRGLGLDPLIKTCRTARELGTRVMVHCTDPPVPMAEMLDVMDDGDILTHVYHGHGETLLDGDGWVTEAARQARSRGVIFDVGDAGWHLCFDIARRAIEQGFSPDTISTDMTVNGLYQPQRSFSLPYGMSKMLHLGMKIDDIIRCTTLNPAKVLGLEGQTGCLSAGIPADIAILREQSCDVRFTDGKGDILQGNRLLRVMMTIRADRTVYRDISF